MTKVKEPKKPLFDCLLYRWFGVETSRYQRYWKSYSEFMQYLLSVKNTDSMSIKHKFN